MAHGPNDPYYHSHDLDRFGEVGKNAPELAKKFFDWYGAVFADGALSAREKSLIALAVAVSGTGATGPSLPGRNPALFQSVDTGFLYVLVDETKLSAEFVRASGTVDFTKTIEKGDRTSNARP